ncbi:hypothetical protein KC957_01865 [Candidatus Saccharibacteria bacterium]|nr:hypothetical protein [Candidatus Saccharibacteria bacterium]
MAIVDETDQRIMELLVEQLRTPLVQIRQLLERGDEVALRSADVVSAQGLRALDAYLMTRQPHALQFEPVAVGGVLYDVAHELTPLAKQYGREIQLDHRAKFGSLLADKVYLHQLLSLVGEVMIKAPHVSRDSREVVLGSHSSQTGVVAGAFLNSTEPPLASTQYSIASWQPDASVEVATLLAARLETALRAYKHYTLPGIGIRLSPSRQLRLWT